MPIPPSTALPIRPSSFSRFDVAGAAHSPIDIPTHAPASNRDSESTGCPASLAALKRPGSLAIATCGLAALGGTIYLAYDSVKGQSLEGDGFPLGRSGEVIAACSLGVVAIGFGVAYHGKNVWARAR